MEPSPSGSTRTQERTLAGPWTVCHVTARGGSHSTTTASTVYSRPSTRAVLPAASPDAHRAVVDPVRPDDVLPPTGIVGGVADEREDGLWRPCDPDRRLGTGHRGFLLSLP
jgi:hypothetical protein